MSKPDGFQTKCGFDRIRAILGMEEKKKFDRNQYYRCDRGQAEFIWNGGNSMYAYPLKEWPEQDNFWEMMRLLNNEEIELEELKIWAQS